MTQPPSSSSTFVPTDPALLPPNMSASDSALGEESAGLSLIPALSETQAVFDDFNHWAMDNEQLFYIDPSEVALVSPTAADAVVPAPAPLPAAAPIVSTAARKAKAPSPAAASSSSNWLKPTKDRFQPFEKGTSKADELAKYIEQEVFLGAQDFQLTSAVRYDPALYVHEYANTSARPKARPHYRLGVNATSDSSSTTLISSAPPSASSSQTPLGAAVPTTEQVYQQALAELQKSIEEQQTVPDECFFLLELHQKRLQFAADFFNWDVELTLDTLRRELNKAICNVDWRHPYKIRTLIDSTGQLSLHVMTASPRPNIFSGLKEVQIPGMDPVYDVYLDTESVMVGPFTSFKTTKRDIYDKARARSLRGTANPNPLQEVVLYNTRDEVTEGSVANIAFLRDGIWKTPPLGTGCLCGVVRHHLLTKKAIQEAVIPVKSLRNGEPVLLFNGVQGVVSGILRLD